MHRMQNAAGAGAATTMLNINLKHSIIRWIHLFSLTTQRRAKIHNSITSARLLCLATCDVLTWYTYICTHIWSFCRSFDSPLGSHRFVVGRRENTESEKEQQRSILRGTEKSSSSRSTEWKQHKRTNWITKERKYENANVWDERVGAASRRREK